MDYKPIIFGTEMVRAILRGRKTMTRRVIKEVPTYDHLYFTSGPRQGQPKHIMDWDLSGVYLCEDDGWGDKAGSWYLDVQTDVDDNSHREIVPTYKPGDILWVRESWAKVSDWVDVDPAVGLPDGYAYKAEWPGNVEHPRWRSSMFMPKDCARIFLRVTAVRAERVQEITPLDAWHEGCRIGNSIPWDDHIPELKQICRDVIFKGLWDEINGKRAKGAYAWERNPWVWVYTFERAEKPDGWTL